MKTDSEARLPKEMKEQFVRFKRAVLIASFGDSKWMSDLEPSSPSSSLNIHASLLSYFSQVVLFLLFSKI